MNHFNNQEECSEKRDLIIRWASERAQLFPTCGLFAKAKKLPHEITEEELVQIADYKKQSERTAEKLTEVKLKCVMDFVRSRPDDFRNFVLEQHGKRKIN